MKILVDSEPRVTITGYEGKSSEDYMELWSEHGPCLAFVQNVGIHRNHRKSQNPEEELSCPFLQAPEVISPFLTPKGEQPSKPPIME